MMLMEMDRISRQRLRNMKNGETITVNCTNGYDLDSQRNTAYFMQKMENCKYSCQTEGLTLTVTRLNK